MREQSADCDSRAQQSGQTATAVTTSAANHITDPMLAIARCN